MTSPHELDQRFRAAVAALPVPASRRDPELAVHDDTTLTGTAALGLFDAQLTSRHIELAGRWLRSFGEGFHVVGSAGHEAGAAVAAALRPTDPAMPHHRATAFACVRAAQHGHRDAIRDLLRPMVGSTADPGSGGRHASFAHPALHLLPTVGGYAAHLPRAVGVAFAIERSARLRVSSEPADAGTAAAWPPDAIAVAGFGDGGLNRTDALSALTAAGWCDRSGLRLPLLFVCEDNGYAGAVRAPDGWTEEVLRSRPGLHYVPADGTDLLASHAAATEAVTWVRRHRRPAVLHLRTVRLLGHGPGDQELRYRAAADLEQDLAADPLVATARQLVAAGLTTGADIITWYDEIGWQLRKAAEEVLGEPRLTDAASIIAPIAARRPAQVSQAVTIAASHAQDSIRRATVFGGTLPEQAGGRTLGATITAALTDAMLSHPSAILFGPDVAGRGGPYGITMGLREQFGAARVFDTLADETAVLGLGLGAGLGGLLPIVELPDLSSLRSADEQLRGQGATLGFASAGQYRHPLVVRVPGLPYAPAVGGLSRNDHALAALRDTPGLVLAVPARAADAAPMLRTCLSAAATDGSLCVFVEPAGLYQARDLYVEGDEGWLDPYEPPARWADGHIPIGRAGSYQVGSGADLTIVTYGSSVRPALRIARELAGDDIGTTVLDLRWLSPLPTADLAQAAAATGRVLIVDETRRSGGVGEGIIAALLDAGFVGAARRIAAADSFIPLGPAAAHVLVGEDAIRDGAWALLGR